MSAEGKQKVCIHCRQPDGIEPVGVVEGNQEVGLVYCCPACQARTKEYAMDIFLYGPDDEKSQRMLH